MSRIAMRHQQIKSTASDFHRIPLKHDKRAERRDGLVLLSGLIVKQQLVTVRVVKDQISKLEVLALAAYRPDDAERSREWVKRELDPAKNKVDKDLTDRIYPIII